MSRAWVRRRRFQHRRREIKKVISEVIIHQHFSVVPPKVFNLVPKKYTIYCSVAANFTILAVSFLM